jgi:hypothetical protein
MVAVIEVTRKRRDCVHMVCVSDPAKQQRQSGPGSVFRLFSQAVKQCLRNIANDFFVLAQLCKHPSEKYFRN